MMAPKFFANSSAFRKWLETNSTVVDELLVGFHKVASGQPSMSWSESVDEALCFGWIDGVRKRIDERSYQIRFTPRKSTSIWSAVNIAKIEKLRVGGRITTAGETAFAHRRDAKSVVYSYEQQGTAKLSRERTQAFKSCRQAWQFFQSTPPSYRKVMLHWVTSAQKPETRDARFAALVKACSDGKRLR